MRINPKWLLFVVVVILLVVAVWLFVRPHGRTSQPRSTSSSSVVTSTPSPASPSPVTQATARTDPQASIDDKAVLNARVKKFAELYLPFSPDMCDHPQQFLLRIKPYVTASFYQGAFDGLCDSDAGQAIYRERATTEISNISDLLGEISDDTASGFITYSYTKYSSSGEEVLSRDGAQKQMTWIKVKGVWLLDSLTVDG